MASVMTAPVSIGVEIGQHFVHAVAVDDNGTIRGTALLRSGPPVQASAFRQTLDQLSQENALPASLKVGVAAFDPAAAAVRELAGSRTVFHAGAAAIAAEAWRGAARDARCAVALVVGDQIAAGVMAEGVVWRGAHGLAGSASWLALNPVERQDYRRMGCFEAEASGPGIARRLAWRVEAGDHSAVVARAGGSLAAVTAAHVFEAARERDAVAISVVRDTARYIAMAIANLAAVVDPEVVVLCGIVADAGDLLLDPIRQETLRRLSPTLATALRIEPSSLGASVIPMGAARLAVA